MIDKIHKKLKNLANPQKVEILQRFFKTGKGEYGEGDKFLGVVVPDIRKIAKKYSQAVTLKDLKHLVKSKYHEERLLALIMLVLKYAKVDAKEQEKIYKFYLNHTKYINNWDLVDLTAEHIVGAYLEDKDKNILETLAESKNLWERRIAILSTFHYIKNKDSKHTFKIAEILLNDKHDLIHKAVGWMLKEVGKRCGEEVEEMFLKKYHKRMPRTMLRYAIEKFSLEKRNHYLGK